MVSASAKLGTSSEPCPVCGVARMGVNADHGCLGCEIFVKVRARLRKRLAPVLLRSGRCMTPKVNAEVLTASLEVLEEIKREYQVDD